MSHFKVSLNRKYYTNLGSHFVGSGMYSIHINGSSRRMKQTTPVRVGDILHMVDQKNNSYWRGVVETEFSLATKETSFFSKPEVEACRIERVSKDWNPLCASEMISSVSWTLEILTEELKEVINNGFNAVTIKPINTTAIEQALKTTYIPPSVEDEYEVDGEVIVWKGI